MLPNSQDVIIIGLGAMGTAAAYHCSRRGLSVLGLEQFEIGHDRGSSHGKSRVIRKAYFEDPRYVPLLHSAYQEWGEIERATNQKLLHLVGCLNMGPPNHECIKGVQTSVCEHGLDHETLSATEIEARWPFFQPAGEDVGIFEQQAGFIPPETAIACLADLAKRTKARLRTTTPVRRWSVNGKQVNIETDAEQFTAASLIITTGAWLPTIFDSPLPLQVERQVQAWFKPSRPQLFAASSMPAFIHFSGNDGFYGIPPMDGESGIKIARHHGGKITTPETVDRSVNKADEADIRNYIRRHIPAADGPMIDTKICLYTNTPDSHFIIDRHPRYENVWIAGGFSGHGFKFAPLVGNILADLVIDGKTAHPVDLFSITRFR